MAVSTVIVTQFPAGKSAEESDRTRQIIAAADALLQQEGLEGLTIRAVLARTGLARRAFYDRFATKDDLVLAVFRQTLQDSAVYFRLQAAVCADPLERVRLIVRGLVMGALGVYQRDDEPVDRRAAAMAREHMRLADARPHDLLACLRPLLDLIAEELEEAQRAGVVRPCDPALTAKLIYNLVSNTLHTEVLAGEGVRPDRDKRRDLAEIIWEFCRRAIVA